MVVSLACDFDGFAVRIEDGDVAGRAGGHFADVPQRKFGSGGDLGDGQALGAGGGEAEFVVVAAGQLTVEGEAAQVGVVAVAAAGQVAQVRQLDQLDRGGAGR